MASRILAAVRAVYGSDAAITPETLAPLDHFNARGVAATQELVALLDPQVGESLLDIGSGIGGPALDRDAVRLHGDRRGCDGRVLRGRARPECGVWGHGPGADRRRHRPRLPFPAASFDRAYSHGVLRSIADKGGVYREAWRVLRPSGRLVLVLRHAGPNGPPDFPVSWASGPAQSFLATDADTHRDLTAAGFAVVALRDTTQEEFAAQTALGRTIEVEGPPPLGMQVLISDRLRQRRLNAYNALRDGRTRMVQIVARKPS